MKADAQLQADVLTDLHNIVGLDTTQICVEVKDGVVSLSGEVETIAGKSDAERITQAAPGVLGFSSDICVMQPGLSNRTDAEIALAAENVLRWMSFATTHPIKVEVEAGLVTLSGELELEYQRRAVLAAVRHIVGVTGVSDYILVDVHHDANTRELVTSSALLSSNAVLPRTLLPSAAASA